MAVKFMWRASGSSGALIRVLWIGKFMRRARGSSGGSLIRVFGRGKFIRRARNNLFFPHKKKVRVSDFFAPPLKTYAEDNFWGVGKEKIFL